MKVWRGLERFLGGGSFSSGIYGAKKKGALAPEVRRPPRGTLVVLSPPTAGEESLFTSAHVAPFTRPFCEGGFQTDQVRIEPEREVR